MTQLIDFNNRFHKDRAVAYKNETKEQRYQRYLFEKEFHFKILEESDAQKRKELYKIAYARLYKHNSNIGISSVSRGFANYYYTTFKKLITNKKLLDFGCGNGNSTTQFSNDVSEVYGIDITSQQIIENNKRKNKEKIHYLVFSPPDLPFEDKFFDVVYSNDVAEHLHPDDLIFHIKEVHRVLKNGGIYICITPNKFLGPTDVSRYYLKKGETALGLHIKEYSYWEISNIFIHKFSVKSYPISMYLANLLKINKSLTNLLLPIRVKILIEKLVSKRFVPEVIKRILINPIVIVATKK
ncbi:MAG: putative methyltransferase YcgJ [Candidatus Heimdallarchaeota archaeon LC_2]|nr:MAG: putative methyltransferase YcgJ [Candidatus Heimdallarchaeota archaeon LC_2]